MSPETLLKQYNLENVKELFTHTAHSKPVFRFDCVVMCVVTCSVVKTYPKVILE